jgi:hypothetical protein
MEEMNVTYYYKENTCIYYSHESQLYHPTFPIDWARHHKPNTGPLQCEECRENRSWNGIFFGYCEQCLSKYESNSSMLTMNKEYYNAVKEMGFTPITPLCRLNTHGNSSFSLINRPQIGDLKEKRSKYEFDNCDDEENKDAMEIDTELIDKSEFNETDYDTWETASESDDDDADSITIEYGYGSNCNGGYDSY